MDKPTADITGKFVGEDLSPATPIQRHFPEFDFPQGGKTLQVGLFKYLEGAEIQQSELTSLGLYPHVEKRISVDGMLYAVVIGPLDDETHFQTVATLQANDLRYFHKKESGS